jgi:hypothetical protein
MKRTGVVLFGMFVVAAGCSSKNGYFFGDGGPEGGPGSVVAGDDSGISKKDASTKKDSGGSTKDTGTGDFDSGDPVTGCAPGDVSSFSPSWKGPTTFHQAKCTALQVETLMACNFDDTADPTMCKAALADAGNTNCENCLFTDSTASKLGPVVIEGSVGSINVAGCIANSQGNTTSTGCGAKYQAANQCADEACNANCPGDTQAALTERNQCVQDALAGDCSSYATDAKCADTLLDTGGVAEQCNQGATFLDLATAIGKLFCAN